MSAPRPLEVAAPSGAGLPSAALAEPLAWRARAQTAALWVGLGFALTQCIRLGSSVLLTRLLAPEMYGLMTLGVVLLGIAVMSTDCGFSQQLVQRADGEQHPVLDTLWTLQVLRGALLCLILLLAAGALWALARWAPHVLSGSYADPRLPGVLAILSCVPLAAGLESTRLARAQRALDLRRVVRNELLAQGGATLLAALLAWSWAAWWVLPAGWLVQAVVLSLLSHASLPGPRPRLGWHRGGLQAAWGPSRQLLLSSALGSLYREGDRLLLGALLPADGLGLYAMGGLLVGAVREVINRLVAQVAMPALAEVARQRPDGLRQAYRQCRLPVDVLCLLAAAGLHAAAAPLVAWLFDPRYAQAAIVLGWLAWGLAAARYTVTEQFLLAIGHYAPLWQRACLQCTTLALALPLGFAYAGLPGALMGVLLAQFAYVPLMLGQQARHGLLDWRLETVPLLLLPLGWWGGRLLC